MTNQEKSTDSVELDNALKGLRYEVALADDLKGLLGDQRFINVFLEDFCKKTVAHEVGQLISANEILREGALEKIKAAKFFEAYMDYVLSCGSAAKSDVAKGSN
jgi:hypothetical protein